MTDRRTQGVFSDYMAGVCADLADRPPAWAYAAQFADLGAVYRRRATKFHDDAQRQRERAGRATSLEGSSG